MAYGAAFSADLRVPNCLLASGVSCLCSAFALASLLLEDHLAWERRLIPYIRDPCGVILSDSAFLWRGTYWATVFGAFSSAYYTILVLLIFGYGWGVG